MANRYPVSKEDLLGDRPPAVDVPACEVRCARRGARRLIVLDDDPTGTQSVSDLPVLTSWSEPDLRWALETEEPAIYVMTNSRSLDAPTAKVRNAQVAQAALEAATHVGVEIDFVSRSDSTLRGHFPLEPDTLTECARAAGIDIDGTIIVPAFGDAGRITVGGVHYAGSAAEGYLPVGETEFARDATFGYRSSDLREWVEEKTGGRINAAGVALIPLETLRTDRAGTVRVLNSLTHAAPVVVDIVEESDLRLLALAIHEAEESGKRYVHRVGPPFVRALIGQQARDPLTSKDVALIRSGGAGGSAPYGLVVVGSHVGLTTRQLERLRERRNPIEIEIDVHRVLAETSSSHLRGVIDEAVRALATGNIVIRTSRTLVKGAGPAASLAIARTVSDAVVTVVQGVLARTPLRFVVAKGGITSSDVASRGLEISRAMVRGPMLPGIVSLWEPMDGPARGIPYIVFAGNVGDEDSLADVIHTLTHETKL